MVYLATKVMLGATLDELGYSSGLYRTPPYYAVKVPVFSFEKLTDANAILGPEMKSTGEVLGIGKTISEALFKTKIPRDPYLSTGFTTTGNWNPSS